MLDRLRYVKGLQQVRPLHGNVTSERIPLRRPLPPPAAD
jgi:hypothetical protein